jgi:hypothetical protein
MKSEQSDAEPLSPYVAARVTASYADLVLALGKKKQAAASLQQLSLFRCDERVVAALLKCKCAAPWQEQGSFVHANAPSCSVIVESKQLAPIAHNALRQVYGVTVCVGWALTFDHSARAIARNNTALASMDMFERNVSSSDKGLRLAALWTTSSIARFTQDDRGAGARVVAAFLKSLSERRDASDFFMQYAGLSACRALGPLHATRLQAQLTDPVVMSCIACTDAVGARMGLKFLLDRVRTMPAASAAPLLEQVISGQSGANVADTLAKVYFIQLCAVAGSQPALQAVGSMLVDELSFRVVLEAISVLCEGLSWAQLQSLRTPSIVPIMVGKILAAFQSPRPVLHFSALRATTMVAKCWALAQVEVQMEPQPHPLGQLLSLTR